VAKVNIVSKAPQLEHISTIAQEMTYRGGFPNEYVFEFINVEPFQSLDDIEVMMMRCMDGVHHYKEMLGKRLEGEARLKFLQEQTQELLKYKAEAYVVAQARLLQFTQNATRNKTLEAHEVQVSKVVMENVMESAKKVEEDLTTMSST